MSVTLTLEFAGSSATALEFADLLDENEVTVANEDETAGPQGFTGAEVLVVYALLLGGVKTAQLVDDMVHRIRQRHRPFIVVDVTGEEPKVTVIEDAPGMKGELLIKSNSGEDIRLDHGASDNEVVTTIQRFLGDP